MVEICNFGGDNNDGMVGRSIARDHDSPPPCFWLSKLSQGPSAKHCNVAFLNAWEIA